MSCLISILQGDACIDDEYLTGDALVAGEHDVIL